MRRLLITLFLILMSSSVLAQSVDCAAVAQKAVESARKACVDMENNQACYGNPKVEIQPRDNVRLAFAKAGDVAPIASLKSISTVAFDDNNWGLALLNVRADLVNGNVTAVSFGKVLLENGSEASNDFVALEITVTEPKGANLRAEPNPDAAIVRAVYSGDRLQAIGRLEDGTWIRIAEGWLSKDLIKSTADLSQLQVLDSTSKIADVYAPMQTISLHTGLEDSPCAGAPDSGLLLQTPVNMSTSMIINGASLNFTGTLLLQTTADGKTVMSMLEGELFYADGYRLKPAQRVEYGFQGDKIIYGNPAEYDYANARYLPLVLMPREFELPFSLGGVIFPFTPGTGFLQTFAADSPCVAAWTADVNLRGGPGTNYPIRRGITGGFYGNPDARAIGSDGAVWWRLVDGVWIAADSTFTAGDCGTLPLVAPPPLSSG
ncbi:MAG: SH3 domain-containing protein [Anaerolineaceae bacterium]|nr:SH3 domain-containing protein [Anaerolineaceae bacterium]